MGINLLGRLTCIYSLLLSLLTLLPTINYLHECMLLSTLTAPCVAAPALFNDCLLHLKAILYFEDLFRNFDTSYQKLIK